MLTTTASSVASDTHRIVPVESIVLSDAISGARREDGFRKSSTHLQTSPAGSHQSTTATASISISHSGAASAVTPTSVLAGGVMPSKNTPRALPMMGRSSGL